MELKSKNYLDKIKIQERQDGVLLEGSLGELEELLLLEDSLLELKGSYGVLRFEITRDEVFSLLYTEAVLIYE